MAVTYEWDVETLLTYDADTNDVIEHYHTKTYAEAVAWAQNAPPEPGVTYHVVLVRDDDDRRSWAYLDDSGVLPAYAEDAYGAKWGKIPQRYHDEVARGPLWKAPE